MRYRLVQIVFVLFGLLLLAVLALSLAFRQEDIDHNTKQIRRLEKTERAACAERKSTWKLRRDIILGATSHARVTSDISGRFQLTPREIAVAQAALDARDRQHDMERRWLLAENGPQPPTC